MFVWEFDIDDVGARLLWRERYSANSIFCIFTVNIYFTRTFDRQSQTAVSYEKQAQLIKYFI